MENSNVIFDTTIDYNQRIIDKYLKTLIQSFISLISFISVLVIIVLLFAILQKEDSTVAWIGFGVILFCGFSISFINIRGIKNCKEAMKKYLGNKFHYTFYQDYFIVEYLVKEESFIDELKYTSIRSASKRNALLTLVMMNNTLLFIDEEQIINFNGYPEVLNLIVSNVQIQSKKNKKRK